MNAPPALSKIDPNQIQQNERPVKRIHDGADITFFLTTTAYRDIMTFMLQLNRSVIPRKGGTSGEESVRSWTLKIDPSTFSEPVLRLRKLISVLEALIADAPPDPGPRRFGNVSFRTWSRLVKQKASNMFNELFSSSVMRGSNELLAYLTGSFGSPERLDYGTGHELSFLAFLACLWKLNYFDNVEPGVEERNIVLGVFEPYLKLVRTLIKTYNLEPAGSHGVWGLDDNSFLPYIFGSAQLAPPIAECDRTPTEGSLPNAPDPASVVKSNLVDKEKKENMYFSAIAFIHEVKKGPFWEHSPMLFDISGIKDGWGKINKGMIKMYNVEVLSKFPVVQHFRFGSLFRWEKDPEAIEPPPSTHTTSQSLRSPIDNNAPSAMRPTGLPSTAAPWAGQPPPPPKGFVDGVTKAPWANKTPQMLPPRGGPTAQLRQPPMRRPAPIAEDAKPVSTRLG